MFVAFSFSSHLCFLKFLYRVLHPGGRGADVVINTTHFDTLKLPVFTCYRLYDHTCCKCATYNVIYAVYLSSCSYWANLKLWFKQKISKEEFDVEARRLLSQENGQ